MPQRRPVGSRRGCTAGRTAGRSGSRRRTQRFTRRPAAASPARAVSAPPQVPLPWAPSSVLDRPSRLHVVLSRVPLCAAALSLAGHCTRDTTCLVACCLIFQPWCALLPPARRALHAVCRTIVSSLRGELCHLVSYRLFHPLLESEPFLTMLPSNAPQGRYLSRLSR